MPLFQQVNTQSGAFTLEVGVYSYQNPTHQSAENMGRCCDKENEFFFPNCTDFCDNIWTFCLRDYNAQISNNGTFDLGQTCISNSEETALTMGNNDNVTFTVGQPFPGNLNLPTSSPLSRRDKVPNPVQLNGTMWTVSLSCTCTMDISCALITAIVLLKVLSNGHMRVLRS